MSQQSNNKISNSEYDELISTSLKNSSAKEKSIALGKVVSIENEIVTIDVGLKSEGRIPLVNFQDQAKNLKSKLEMKQKYLLKMLIMLMEKLAYQEKKRLNKKHGMIYKYLLMKIKW